MLCLCRGNFGKVDLCLQLVNMKASVEYKVANDVFRSKFT